MSAARRLVLLVGALLVFRVLSAAFVVFQPGYTDAYYYADVAKRLAGGQGLTADFIWNFIEATGTLPVPSHRFWMPLATVLQAVGIKGLPFLDAFHGAQAVEILIACAIPVVAYRAARSLGASANGALVAAALAGLGGAFAPGWVSLDAFAPAAVIGTVFFLTYRRAAAGDVRAGIGAGLAVGLLFLARAEGALFGLALLALLRSPASRRAGLIASGIALLIGLGWLARDLALGSSPDLFARSALLVRYEDFFAVRAPVAPSVDQLLASRPAALVTNLVTFAFAFGLLLVPGLARALWTRRDRAGVGVFAGLLVLVYLAESLVFTLHSTRGSYFHSLAAFLPFGVALGVVGTTELLGTVERSRVAAIGGLTAALIVSVFALAQWDASFNPPYRDRVAALASIPAGPFAAIDAAAWRWIADRPVIVTPSDAGGSCTVLAYGAGTLVLEPVHFSIYTPLYETSRPAAAVGGIRMFTVRLPPSAMIDCLRR
ncbi:MAG TPA: hypothetical protein VGT60_08145 [Candidatus Limnocylindria bacterium]|nr:hypothetical protein [Candidatus Limnocylindria bacterium]